MKEYSVKKGIYIDTLNCVEDHIHVLISLGIEQPVSKVMNLLKGESSHWVNQQNIIRDKFEWQDEYIGLSVSNSAVDRVREYIANQEQHHATKTFAQEYQEFLAAHGFVAKDSDGI